MHEIFEVRDRSLLPELGGVVEEVGHDAFVNEQTTGDLKILHSDLMEDAAGHIHFEKLLQSQLTLLYEKRERENNQKGKGGVREGGRVVT
jgi:hypothetical protein